MRRMLILLLVMTRKTFPFPFCPLSLTVVVRAPLLLSRAAFLNTALFRVVLSIVIVTLLSTLLLMMSSSLHRLISSEFEVKGCE